MYENSSKLIKVKCASLNTLFANNSVLSRGSPRYDSFTGAYWSGQQGAVSPSCVFKPTKVSEVSTVVLLARLYQCSFAVKGGGHAAFAGASSIEDGITISLENFKQVKVATDKKTVDVGHGMQWVDVYTAVEHDGLSVAGGRVSPDTEVDCPTLTDYRWHQWAYRVLSSVVEYPTLPASLDGLAIMLRPLSSSQLQVFRSLCHRHPILTYSGPFEEEVTILALSRTSNSTRSLWARCGVAIVSTLKIPSQMSWTPSVTSLLKGRRKTRTPPRFWYVRIILSLLFWR